MQTATAVGRIVPLTRLDVQIEDPIFVVTRRDGTQRICFSYSRAMEVCEFSTDIQLKTREELEAMTFEKFVLN